MKPKIRDYDDFIEGYNQLEKCLTLIKEQRDYNSKHWPPDAIEFINTLEEMIEDSLVEIGEY